MYPNTTYVMKTTQGKHAAVGTAWPSFRDDYACALSYPLPIKKKWIASKCKPIKHSKQIYVLPFPQQLNDHCPPELPPVFFSSKLPTITKLSNLNSLMDFFFFFAKLQNLASDHVSCYWSTLIVGRPWHLYAAPQKLQACNGNYRAHTSWNCTHCLTRNNLSMPHSGEVNS